MFKRGQHLRRIIRQNNFNTLVVFVNDRFDIFSFFFMGTVYVSSKTDTKQIFPSWRIVAYTYPHIEMGILCPWLISH
jgi:hypothetical protein